MLVETISRPVLPDLLRPELKVVFCGTAAGNHSAEQGFYYADPRNRFWSALADAGFTDEELKPKEYLRLLDFGIGLTDLAKHVHGLDNDLSASTFDAAGLMDRIRRVVPVALAFNGKKAASIFLNRRTCDVTYGRQHQTLGATAIYVLPSTSAAARKYWSSEPWSRLARDIANKSQRGSSQKPSR